MDTTDPEKIGPKAVDVDGTQMLQLLQDCSGVFQPGILTALVGSSGAGKTTLMDVLAGRKTSGKITGDIRVAGFPKKQETFARVMGYCEQVRASPRKLVADVLICAFAIVDSTLQHPSTKGTHLLSTEILNYYWGCTKK